MAQLEDQNTVFPGYGEDIGIPGNVQIIYDATATGTNAGVPFTGGFRTAKTTDLGGGGGGGGGGGLISGTVNVGNFPASQNVTGVLQLSGTVNATGTVGVSNFPAVQAISGIVTQTPAQFTPAISTVTGSGSVGAGQHYVEFIFSTGFVGTIQNSYFYGSNTLSYAFPVLQNNSTYGVISYNIPTGSAQLVNF